MFSSNYLILSSSGRKIFYLHSTPKIDKNAVPIVAIHGLGGASTFWVPALRASGLIDRVPIYAYDFDGHGLSDFSGRNNLTIHDLVEDLKEILVTLGLNRVVLLCHSMSCIVATLFSQRFPEKVDKMILLHPVRNLSPLAKDGILARAKAASAVEGMGGIANTVAASAVSKNCATIDFTTTALIRLLVASTKPEAYAAACLALASAPVVSGEWESVRVHLIGGEEDSLATPQMVNEWAEEAGGTVIILRNVGHWGAIEMPNQVGKEIAQAIAPTSYHILLGAFSSPDIYTLHFDVQTQKLRLLHGNTTEGGHSWLDISPSQKVLYATVWTDPPTVSSYQVLPASHDKPYPTIKLLRSSLSTFRSGYVCSTERFMYSACGPQVDVFELDEVGALKDQTAVQTLSLRTEGDRHKSASQMDFGGLRHGGHSCDLSPDKSKLYVADIGQNCVWMYHVDNETGLLALASKNLAKRSHDGPRHTWPHPNGRFVYSLQEHSSYVDVLRLTPAGDALEWAEGVNILPERGDCNKYWADEVRLSPTAEFLFGSTRGLEPGTNGYVTAWALSPDGQLAQKQVAGKDSSLHRFQTRTSGGWANAIAVCPNLSPYGEVYMTLTDSEVGFVQILAYSRTTGFVVLDEVVLRTSSERIGASVAVWL